MSKGSKRRPRQISREEEELRWQLATGEINKKTFDEKMKETRKEF